MKKQNTILMSIAVITAIGMASLTLIQSSGQETISIQYSSSLPDFPVEFLAEQSEFAIKGKVVSITSLPVQFYSGIPSINTDVTIDVEKDLFGKYTGKQITVRISGGEFDNYKISSDASPTFEVGKKVLVLVHEPEPESIFGDSYYVSGWELGKYDLSDGQAKNKRSDKNMSESDLTTKVQKAKSEKGY